MKHVRETLVLLILISENSILSVCNKRRLKQDFLRVTSKGSGETFCVRQTKAQARLSACDKQRLRRDFLCATNEGSGETFCARQTKALLVANTHALSVCVFKHKQITSSHVVMFACCTHACIISINTLIQVPLHKKNIKCFRNYI